MPFLFGQSRQDSNANPQTTGLQNQLVDFLGRGNGGLDRLFPGTEINPDDIQPFLDLFSQQNARTLGQAKESAGNLTGSGFANTLGARAGESATAQNAFLANFFEERRREDANRFAGVLLGSLNSNAGGVTNSYQPGFLDYLFQGAGAAASGGAFNGLFNSVGAVT